MLYTCLFRVFIFPVFQMLLNEFNKKRFVNQSSNRYSGRQQIRLYLLIHFRSFKNHIFSIIFFFISKRIQEIFH
jgi:riboflavin transporter FmnP